MERRDWTDLITHHTSTFTLQDVFFCFAATVRLQRPAGTPEVDPASSETTYV